VIPATIIYLFLIGKIVTLYVHSVRLSVFHILQHMADEPDLLTIYTLYSIALLLTLWIIMRYVVCVLQLTVSARNKLYSVCIIILDSPQKLSKIL